MNTPLVSIVIPVYNVEKYLRECVDSVLAQTYQNIEVILVDDGANDSSGEICNEYSTREGQVQIIHKKNGGQSSARNIGIKYSLGEFILFVDSDDLIRCDLVEKCVSYAKHNNTDVVFFNADSFLDGSNRSIKQTYHRRHNYSPASGLIVFEELIKNKEYLISPCLIFVKRELLQNGLLFKEGIIYEDMIFTYQVFVKAQRVGYLPDSFYLRRYRTNSTVTSKNGIFGFNSSLEVYYQVYAFAIKEGLIQSQTHQRYLSRCAFSVLHHYSELSYPDKKMIKKEIIAFKKHLRQNAFLNDPALKARSKGYFQWMVYKVFESIAHGVGYRIL